MYSRLCFRDIASVKSASETEYLKFTRPKTYFVNFFSCNYLKIPLPLANSLFLDLFGNNLHIQQSDIYLV